jgi:hypothetical protein
LKFASKSGQKSWPGRSKKAPQAYARHVLGVSPEHHRERSANIREAKMHGRHQQAEEREEQMLNVQKFDDLVKVRK